MAISFLLIIVTETYLACAYSYESTKTERILSPAIFTSFHRTLCSLLISIANAICSHTFFLRWKFTWWIHKQMELFGLWTVFGRQKRVIFLRCCCFSPHFTFSIRMSSTEIYECEIIRKQQRKWCWCFQGSKFFVRIERQKLECNSVQIKLGSSAIVWPRIQLNWMYKLWQNKRQTILFPAQLCCAPPQKVDWYI